MSGKRFSVTIFIFFTAAVTCFSADWASIVKDTGLAVARISISDDKGAVISRGTGFMIQWTDGTQRLVTNAHVVADAEHNKGFMITAEFLFDENNPDILYPLFIDSIDRELDLCLLTMETDAPGILQIDKESIPGLMEEVLVVGYPLGRNFKTTPGYLQAYQDIEGMGRMMDLSASVAPGNSGGPVLNDKGQVIGIITSVIPGYNFNLAIPAGNIDSFLQKETSQFEIDINSTPDNAWVFIDGNYKGKTPLTVDLFNREYKLRLEKEGREDYEAVIGPLIEKIKKLDIELESKDDTNPLIEIVVDPEGAEVFVNNQYVGVSPVSVQFPTGSIMRIRIQKRGYKEKLEFYDVAEDESQRVELKMKKGFFW